VSYVGKKVRTPMHRSRVREGETNSEDVSYLGKKARTPMHRSRVREG
jgi:hypothetical protein